MDSKGLMTGDALPLSAEFPPGDEARWRALVDKALDGGSFDKLTTRTHHGVSVKPLYRAPDYPAAVNASGLPGAFPFVRGGRTINDQWLPWDIRQVVAHPDPRVAHEQVMEALQGGVSSIELRVDAAGEQGIAARWVGDLASILEGVKTDLAPIAIEAAGASSAHGLELAALLAEAIGPGTEKLLAFNVDPIGALARTGALPATADVELAEAAAFARNMTIDFRKATALRADARPVHEAGGTEVQELAFLVAAGAEYVRAQMLAGSTALAACRAILFTLSVGADYQVEMAKLRAARRLWSRIADAFDATGSSAAMQLQAVSSRRMLTQRDPWVNMLRNTASCFAAGVGGADIVTLRTFTDAIGLPSKLARRIARNTQVIAQEESSLGKVTDAPGGAWTIEKLGEDLAQAAWPMFQQIESEGGLVRALQTGGFQLGVADARAARMKAVARRKEWITGVNDFPAFDEVTPETETVDLSLIVKRAPEASGRAPRDRSWPSLRAAAADKATLADLAKTSDSGAEAEPLWPVRLAEPFERLRDHAESRTNGGKTPLIFLAALGPLAEHSARLTFAQNFFAAGGIRSVPSAGAAVWHAQALRASGCTIACVCGSDNRYAEEAEATAKLLKAAGAGRVYLAGKPGANEAALRAAGVDEFIHVGVDVLASLELAHAELGLSR
jgi:methylmalonyl-CoA mutase